MNIFYLDTNPVNAARMLCDKHVVKMTLETAQILCTVRHGAEWATYKPTHAKHPSVLWAGSSAYAYAWTAAHGIAIAAEYRKRYGKTHKSEPILRAAYNDTPELPAASEPPPLVMPEIYRLALADPWVSAIRSYRAYYKGEKIGMAEWRKGTPEPDWWR